MALASLAFIGSNALAAEWQVVENAGMEVRLYKPDSEPLVNDKRALMISLHGCAANMNGAQWMQEKANWKPTAEKYGMVVALPAAPNGGAYGYNCWDWKPTDHTRNNYYNKNVLELVENLMTNQELNIDPDQVYISGLSSGAGQALILGCLAPDVFAGMGLSAAPPVGNGNIQNYDFELIASTCVEYAGESAEYFDSQITSILIGSKDDTVPPATQQAIAAAMVDIYQAEEETESLSFPGEWSQAWVDGDNERVVFTEVEGMLHAWAAGGGEGDDWADTTRINYPAHLTEWLFNNNSRTGYCENGCNITDKITVTSEVNGTTAEIFGYIRSLAGALDCEVNAPGDCYRDATIELLDTETLQTKVHTFPLEGHDFDVEISGLEPGDYEATVISPDGTWQNTGVIRIDDKDDTFDFMAWFRELMAKWSLGGSWF